MSHGCLVTCGNILTLIKAENVKSQTAFPTPLLTYIMYFNVIEAVLHFLAGVPVSLLFCSTLICSFFYEITCFVLLGSDSTK